jgi:hypothetical protein
VALWLRGVVQVRNCKVKTTGIALSVDASVPPASAAQGMGVHANPGRASGRRDAMTLDVQ